MEDNYLWLEDVLSERSLTWAKEQNARAKKALADGPLFSSIAESFEKILGNKDKIAFAQFINNGFVYNLWTDEKNLQGLWRRTSIAEFQKENPTWEVLLDLDELSQKENQKWVFAGVNISHTYKRALIYLSPGGSDADYIREFSLEKKAFIEEGFNLPFSKGEVSWINDDEIVVLRDFGEGSMTAAGYPKTARRWMRGSDLSIAPVIFEINASDNSAGSWTEDNDGIVDVVLSRNIDFYHAEYFLYDGKTTTKLDLPLQLSYWKKQKDHFYLQLACDWREFKTGDSVVYFYEKDSAELIFRPDERSSIYSTRESKDGLYMVIDRDVTSSLYHFTRDEKGWSSVKLNMPANGTIDQLMTDKKGHGFFVGYSSFNSPLSYYYGHQNEIVKKIKSMPSFFDHENVEVLQHFVTSPDGTQVPYFLVHKKGIVYNGQNPTILYGYGGFEISLKPNFSNLIGSGWLDRGGVYVLSNIRGGGEYGPRWHQSALKENRDRAYEDFFAIAEDLFKRNITSNKHLGAQGGSNGGLLMGVCYTQRPDLFAAIDCGVPLLDMRRYHKLLAGYSWVAEYGNPDDQEDGRYIRELSPYHRIEKDRKDYPVMYLHTSTKDDRVHPGHARKFAAKLEEYNDSYYYHENIDGGHAGASNLKELAFVKALDYAFFWKHLK